MSAAQQHPAMPDPSGKDHYDEILERIQHLKEIFSLGEEVMPLLEELFLFLNDMTPLLGHVSDHTLVNQGIMPNIANILEGAMDQMTDSTYQIMEQVTDMQDRLNSLGSPNSLTFNNPALLKNEVNKLRTDTDEIINSLQFHDIVSQKLIHVRKVLGQVQSKLISLFACINNLNVSSQTRAYIMQSLGVDIDEITEILSSYIQDDERLTADKLPAAGAGQLRQQPDMTQEEIDRLFG